MTMSSGMRMPTAAKMMWNASDMAIWERAKTKSVIGQELEDDRQTEHEEQRGCGAAYPDHRQSRREVAPGEYGERVGREHPERRPCRHDRGGAEPRSERHRRKLRLVAHPRQRDDQERTQERDDHESRRGDQDLACSSRS